MTRRLLPVALLVLAAPLGAQLKELQVGARVRVQAPTVLGGRLDGTVIARRGDTLTVLGRGVAPIDIPISALSRAEIYSGKSRTAGATTGFLWGFAIGLPVGLAAALGDDKEWNRIESSCNPDYQQCEVYSDVQQTVLVTIGSGGLGAGIGALIGKAQWEVLRIPATPIVSVLPNRTMIGARLALTF